MANYRLYDLNRDGTIRGRTRFACACDTEALAYANSISNEWGLELWRGPYLVKRLKPPRSIREAG